MGVKLGNRILQEDQQQLHEYLVYWKYEDIKYKQKRRFYDAREIYRELKAAFTAQGYTDEAGELHFRERRANKWTHWPWHAKYCYSDDFAKLPQRGFGRLIGRLGFYIKHFINFCGASLAELSCGFGERPLRPAFWALFIILAFAAFFWKTRGVISVTGDVMRMEDYVIYSLAAFTGLDLFNYQPIDTPARFFTSVEALCGIAIMSLFMFTLGVRFARS